MKIPWVEDRRQEPKIGFERERNEG